jgi:hypothetical protein
MTKSATIATLKLGLAKLCADDLEEAMANLCDGTCDWVELIPVLEEIAKADGFQFFDDNGSGGFPHGTGDCLSYQSEALAAIENIKENAKFEATSNLATQLKSNDFNEIKNAIGGISQSLKCVDAQLIPILEKIVKKDSYSFYNYYETWSIPKRCLGASAQNAIDQIRKNIAASSASS